MFLSIGGAAAVSICLPRLGGGVSLHLRVESTADESSPPRRGCFRLIDFVMNYFFDESHYEII